MNLKAISIGVAALLSAGAPPAAAHPSSPSAPGGNFTYNDRDFLLNGKPLQIIGGQMDPQRIPKQYWRHRLQMARAMGLNTIFSYIFWNNVEPIQGQFNFDDRNDVAEFFHIALEEDLHVVLRPGPYICGEHEWGGFPAWLSQIDGMQVRSNNQPFLDASNNFIGRLGSELRELQVTHGGPILLTQLENEYGSFGRDKNYLQALADILRSSFEVPLYTNDGAGADYLAGGTLHGVLAQTDGDPKTGFEARNNLTDPTMLGPLLDGEYYMQWFDSWASNVTHNAPTSDDIDTHVKTLDWILAGNNSFNIYMFHGGTNFAFESGSVNPTSPVTTSYDYGAPLDETGRPTELYWKLRDMISTHVPNGSIPSVPDVPAIAQVSQFPLSPALSLFDSKPEKPSKEAGTPPTMESLGQSYGYVLYEHNVTEDASGTLSPGDKPRDRVIIYVNGQKTGVIDSRYEYPPSVTVSLETGDLLQLFVENQGRVDYSQALREQQKGIVGDVKVGNSVLNGWAAYSLPLSTLPNLSGPKEPSVHDTPMIYTGTFKLPDCSGPDQSRDVLLTFPKSVKGQVWVNNINLGRYWAVGPQQDIYVPGSYVNIDCKINSVVFLELEPNADTDLTGQGVTTRQWGNNPDPDLTVL